MRVAVTYSASATIEIDPAMIVDYLGDDAADDEMISKAINEQIDGFEDYVVTASITSGARHALIEKVHAEISRRK